MGVCSSEGTARASQHIPCKQYSEIPEQVIFRLYLARVQIVTTTHWSYLDCRCLNVLERNGNPHSRYPWSRFVYLRSSRLWSATFLYVQRGADLARLIPRVKRAQSDCDAGDCFLWVSKMLHSLLVHLILFYSSCERFPMSEALTFTIMEVQCL
jgi:hypothetical protein